MTWKVPVLSGHHTERSGRLLFLLLGIVLGTRITQE